MGRRSDRHLSRQQVAEIITCRQLGANVSELMRNYSITREAVKRLTAHIPNPVSEKKRRTKPTKLKETQRAEIMALISQKSFREIAALYGVSSQTLRHFLKPSMPAQGWGKRPKRKGSLTANDIMMARTMRLQGETLQSIADALGISPQSVHRMVKDVAPEDVVWSKGFKLTKEQKKEAVVRRDKGETLAQIAASYQVSIPDIQTIVKRARQSESDGS